MPHHLTEITNFIRERVPEITIVVGGTKLFKSYRIKQLYEAGELLDFPLEWLDNMHYFFGEKKDSADYYIVNTRGEQTLINLIQAVDKGDDVRGMNNVAYYRNTKECVLNPITEEPYLLENFAINWNEVPTDTIGFEIPISVKQGCPYRCNFCDFVGLARKLDNRQWGVVMEEIRSIANAHPGKSLCFVDENLFLSKDHLKEFCTKLIKEKLNIRWRGFTRVDVIDAEAAAILRQAGCYSMALGVESGDPGILINMNKKITPEIALNAITSLNGAGIGTYSTLFIGFPGETPQTVGNTINFLNSYPTDAPAINFYSVNSFYVLPVSPVSRPDMRRQFGLTGYFNKWRHNTMHVDEAVEQVVRLFQEVRNSYLVYLDSSEYAKLDGANPHHREIVRTRQEIVQHRIRKGDTATENRLWARLESACTE